MLRMVLEVEGFSVDVAADGERGLELAQTSSTRSRNFWTSPSHGPRAAVPALRGDEPDLSRVIRSRDSPLT